MEIKKISICQDIQANESRNRENSEVKKVSLDIEAILTVITKREFPHYNEEGKRLDLKMTQLEQADLIGAHLEGANLTGALNLTIDQLSKVKTLYKATLDPDMETLLREKYPALFNKPD